MKPLFQMIGLHVERSNDSSLPSIISAINEAKEEWHNARILFNNVTDTDLIEYATYLILASEKKYIYLLKKAKQDKVRNDHIQIDA